MKRSAISPASKEQRAKVAGRACIVQRASAEELGEPVDPAHLWPRGRGGCDDPLCVVPLSRTMHRAFDDRELDLLPFLEPHYRAEIAHAVEHAGIARVYQRLTGSRYESLEPIEGPPTNPF